MAELSKEQEIQEHAYAFPYHYIPRLDRRGFSQAVTLKWGYEYLSYIRFVMKQMESLEFQSLLDVGCGDGKFLYEVSRRFPHKRLVGLDYSERAIRCATALNPDGKYVCGDIADTALLKERFGLITLIETLEHVPPHRVEPFVRGLYHCLESDGTLIVTVPSVNTKLNAKHYQHFDLESLRKAIEPFFTISEHHFINRISAWSRLAEKLLVNQLFVLNERHLANLIYGSYEKYLLKAKENNTRRICALCKKNS